MDELEKEKKEEEKKRDKSRPSNRNGRDFEKWRIVVKSRTVGIQSVESRLLCLLLQLVVTVFDEFIRDRVGNCVASWMKLSASWIDTVVRHCCPRAFFSAAFVFIDWGEANFLRRTRWDDRKKSTTPPSAFIQSSSHFIGVLLAPLKVPLARPSQLRIRFAVVMQRKNRNRYFQVERKCRKKKREEGKKILRPLLCQLLNGVDDVFIVRLCSIPLYWNNNKITMQISAARASARRPLPGDCERFIIWGRPPCSIQFGDGY